MHSNLFDRQFQQSFLQLTDLLALQEFRAVTSLDDTSGYHHTSLLGMAEIIKVTFLEN